MVRLMNGQIVKTEWNGRWQVFSLLSCFFPLFICVRDTCCLFVDAGLALAVTELLCVFVKHCVVKLSNIWNFFLSFWCALILCDTSWSVAISFHWLVLLFVVVRVMDVDSSPVCDWFCCVFDMCNVSRWMTIFLHWLIFVCGSCVCDWFCCVFNMCDASRLITICFPFIVWLWWEWWRWALAVSVIGMCDASPSITISPHRLCLLWWLAYSLIEWTLITQG